MKSFVYIDIFKNNLTHINNNNLNKIYLKSINKISQFQFHTPINTQLLTEMS